MKKKGNDGTLGWNYGGHEFLMKTEARVDLC
jgi:hypothetical protein